MLADSDIQTIEDLEGKTIGGFDGLVTQLNTGKLDTIANNFAQTEERAKVYQFSTPYAYAHTALGVLADSDIQSIILKKMV